MGNSFSTKTGRNQEEEQRRKLEKQFGVLIPPSFIAIDSSSSLSALPLSCQSRMRQTYRPDLLNELWVLNQGRQLLESYMNPGVTLSVPTATSGQILVSLNTTNEKSSPLPVSSFLWAEQPLNYTTKVNLLIPTASSPCIQLGYKVKNEENSSFFEVKGQASTSKNYSTDLNSNEKANEWIEGRLKTSYRGMDLICSLSSEVSLLQNYFNSLSSRQQQPFFSNPQLQLATEYKQSLLALTAKLEDQTKNFVPKVESSMVCLNLNHNPTNTLGNAKVGSEPPPLWLTLKQKNEDTALGPMWILNLSQILTFDRYVWNFLEERAPKVRQTLGWSIQMETSKRQRAWHLGTTWQINRGLALKGVVKSTASAPLCLQYGMIVKRWNQPRATLTFLNEWDWNKSSHSFLGFGVELHTNSILSNSDATTDYPTAPPKYSDAPPTKVQLSK